MRKTTMGAGRIRHAVAGLAGLGAIATIAAPLAGGVAGATTQRAAPARRAAADWTGTITTRADGAYVMGNPRAKVKLVEYLSLSCSHCAAFAAEGLPALKRDYIARGLVSLEVRHAVRDGFDLAAVLLGRCAGPAGYFRTSARILATQPIWMPKAQAYFAAQAARDPRPEGPAALIEMAHAAGFDAMADGLSPARVRACLSDARQTAIVTAMVDEAFNARAIPGTPAFLINGTLVPATSSWATLQPQLAAALR